MVRTADGHGQPQLTTWLSLAAAAVVAVGTMVFPLTAVAQTVTVRVTILEVKALTNFDGLDEADWFASVTIDGTEFDNEDTPETEDVEGNDHINVSWQFQKAVDLSVGSVAVNIEIRDEDGFLKLGDDLADINPIQGKASLDLTVALAPCSVSGDVSGPCRARINSFSNNDPEDGDGRAEVHFRVEVLDVPGLHVRCTHVPIWPQPGQQVTLRVDALDDNLNGKTVDSVFISRENLPDSAQSSAGSHSLTMTPTGESFVYGCGAQGNGDEVFSGWRRVIIGDPPEGRAVPVLFTTTADTGVDIVVVPDQDSYAGTTDPLFLEHAASVVYNAIGGLYGERVFLEHQHQINVYLALDTAEARPYAPNADEKCPHVLPANADEYGFAEALAIIHTDVFRDCANGANRVFSARPPVLATNFTHMRVFLHELGHRPFGLADEYCNKRPGSTVSTCDGGYFENTPFPNIFTSATACAADAAAEGFGTVTCDQWTDDEGKGPWSTYDPNGNDLMNDNGDAQFLDIRRITDFFASCSLGAC